MQCDRAGIGGVADDRKHLAPGSALASADQFVEQRGAYAAAAPAVGDIDRILDREAIGRTRAISGGVGEARGVASRLGDEIGQAELNRRAPAREHLLKRRRRLLESGERVEDVIPKAPSADS